LTIEATGETPITFTENSLKLKSVSDKTESNLGQWQDEMWKGGRLWVNTLFSFMVPGTEVGAGMV
jgi:hypothetical protein